MNKNQKSTSTRTHRRPEFRRQTVILACILLAVVSASTRAQDISKRQLEHKAYDFWHTLGPSAISNDGQWAFYTVVTGKPDGDNVLTIRKIGGQKEYSVPRGSDPQFTFDSRHMVYMIQPSEAVVKKLKKEKADPEEMPVAKLQILDLDSGEQLTFDRIRSFKLPRENGDWIAFLEIEAVNASNVTEQTSSVNESYEVTPTGLRRPKKKLKLKKRESLEAPQEQESKVEQEEAEIAGKAVVKSEKRKSEESTSDSTDQDEKKEKQPGTQLVLHNLKTGNRHSFPLVNQYTFSRYGDALAFATSVKREEDVADNENDPEKTATRDNEPTDENSSVESMQDRVFVFDLKNQEPEEVFAGKSNFEMVQLNDDGDRLAFLADAEDFEADTPAYALYLWRAGESAAKKIVDEKTEGIPESWWVSASANLIFSEDDRRLFFSTAPIPETVIQEREKAEKKENGQEVHEDDDEPKAKLDIWHWQDPYLQPQQLIQAEMERSRSYRAVFDLRKKKTFQLATRQVPDIQIDRRSTSDVAAANSNWHYRKMMSWDIQTFQDTFIISLKNGDRRKVRERVRGPASISPAGLFITWFDAQQLKWFAMSTKQGSEPVEISAGIDTPLQDELHDTPSLPRSYGSPGWLADDKSMLLYDRYDIWQVDPNGKEKPICLTEGAGRKDKIRFRYIQLDPEMRSIAPDETLLLSAFDEDSKSSGLYRLRLRDLEKGTDEKETNDKTDDETDGNALAEQSSRLEAIVMLPERITGVRKARDADAVLMTRESFRDSPDLWSSTMDFKTLQRISDINPQQEEYLWGDVELVKWNAEDGQELEGLLYKPDGFDPEQKYPLMVYFYERNSNNLHRYYAPAAGRSIINFSFYVSRGYVIFVPDIPYKTGEPGPSAANSVLPGVEAIVSRGFIDPDKIGMQGHSWGGYQAAYLVTQTDMFACAESGAPVSNMTSAYGGIRWGSGMSRMFQYERTQSRIGEDLWTARDKYIANSPLFFVDKINTPLLILHNDEDGAVPWYQGIELFVAMRRLGKPAWLLNYNEQPHWVMKPENRVDFAIRMQQFFDHYLKDAPEPEWMAVGIPAVDKGKKFGLELLEPLATEERAGEEKAEANEESNAEEEPEVDSK